MDAVSTPASGPADQRRAGPVRLLFITPSLRGGGAERQLVQLVKQQDPGRYAVTVATMTPRSDAEQTGYYAEVAALSHVRLVELPRYGKFDFVRPLLALVRLIRRERIEIIHSFLNLASTFGVIAARITGVPIVASAIRDSRDPGMIYRLCRIAQARSADFLVSNSQAGFDNRFANRRANFRVIVNGLDMGRFAPRPAVREQLYEQLGLARFRHLVGMVASLTELKDHEAFIELAARVVAERPGTGFLVIGDGPRRAEIGALVEKRGLGDWMVFTGFLADVEVLTGMLDVACLFTNYRIISEGLPNAVMEAMACGVPVIATADGGTVELLRDGVEGFLVERNDPELASRHLARLLGDAELRSQMGTLGRQAMSERFSLGACVVAYEQLYARCLKR